MMRASKVCSAGRWCGLTLIVLVFGLPCTAARATSVVTDHVVSLSTRTQTRVPVTFGQVFKAGDVPKGETVVAILNGVPVPLQVDVKATNPDGSLRHAVLTALLPALTADASVPLALATAADTQTASAVNLAQLLDATNYDATVSLAVDGTVYTLHARALLEQARAQGHCKAWNKDCNTWLAGPLVSEWVVGAPLLASDGKDQTAHLMVYFCVRAYAGATSGTIAYVRTNVIVENTWAYQPQAQPQYTATLTSGSASYASTALTQYAYTRWHHVLWWNGVQPQVYLRQDTGYIQDSMAVSKYAPLQPTAAFLATVRQSCPPLAHCDQTQHMGNEGAQPAIGPLPRWTSVYILDPDVRAYRWMLANSGALGAYSVHYRDRQTGWPLSIQHHPDVTIMGWAYAQGVADGISSSAAAYRRDLLPTCTNDAVVHVCGHPWYGNGNPDYWDNAHQPAAGYVAYMVTGSYYYMGELAFYASMSELNANESYRGFSRGLIDAARGQVRGKAWVLRQMVNAAWLLPDHYPLKAEFNADVDNALTDFNSSYTYNPMSNALGLLKSGAIYTLNGQGDVAVAPWQHDFLTWSVGHAAELGFPGAAAFRRWLSSFELGLMGGAQIDPMHGYCWLLASKYAIAVKDAAGHKLPGFNAIYATSFPTLQGLACNSPAMISALSKLVGQPWQRNEMVGYPYSPTGFPADFQIGLAAAVDSGSPGAAAAWTLFQSRRVKPAPPDGYANYPNFAVVPRSVNPPISSSH